VLFPPCYSKTCIGAHSFYLLWSPLKRLCLALMFRLINAWVVFVKSSILDYGELKKYETWALTGEDYYHLTKETWQLFTFYIVTEKESAIKSSQSSGIINVLFIQLTFIVPVDPAINKTYFLACCVCSLGWEGQVKHWWQSSSWKAFTECSLLDRCCVQLVRE
jgi:hypothetical protein